MLEIKLRLSALPTHTYETTLRPVPELETRQDLTVMWPQCFQRSPGRTAFVAKEEELMNDPTTS
jgi:hypothetical protein